jgi:glyoxylase-like metal-dependent hydrolase (beta-lactamase superfamily II)
MAEPLVVADPWFRVEPVGDGISLITELHVHPYLSVNVWHVRGERRDLLVDTGNGIGRLQPLVEGLAEERSIVAVVTHWHFDHAGGLHEFDDRRSHSADAGNVTAPPEVLRLRATDLSEAFLAEMAFYGSEPTELLIDALPEAGFDPAAFATAPTEPTSTLEDGDRIDLGGRVVEVVHVPGHTPGSIALFDRATGAIFTGDAAYVDDPIDVDDEEAFRSSFERLSALPVEVVHPGHNRSFGRDELLELAGRAKGSDG